MSSRLNTVITADKAPSFMAMALLLSQFASKLHNESIAARCNWGAPSTASLRITGIAPDCPMSNLLRAFLQQDSLSAPAAWLCANTSPVLSILTSGSNPPHCASRSLVSSLPTSNDHRAPAACADTNGSSGPSMETRTGTAPALLILARFSALKAKLHRQPAAAARRYRALCVGGILSMFTNCGMTAPSAAATTLFCDAAVILHRAAAALARVFRSELSSITTKPWITPSGGSFCGNCVCKLLSGSNAVGRDSSLAPAPAGAAAAAGAGAGAADPNGFAAGAAAAPNGAAGVLSPSPPTSMESPSSACVWVFEAF
mmetsp:Transcript_25686/g.59208  ORF Transcript_25686/g.59208 Transcript_25686/m.59208 type:complete len:315 (-) Transcript_25686:1493-2437(-)